MLPHLKPRPPFLSYFLFLQEQSGHGFGFWYAQAFTTNFLFALVGIQELILSIHQSFVKFENGGRPYNYRDFVKTRV